ncbi:MAG: HmuY family protein [Bacteroidota bacterium]
MKRHFFLISLSLAVALMSCDKDEADPVTPPANGGKLIVYSNLVAEPALNSGRFQYFRLSDSAIVPFSDSGTTKWDLAFSSTTIRTNSGGSGPGQGGAIVLTGTFEEVITAPESGYSIDTTTTKPAIRTGSGNGWYNYNFSTMIVTPIPGKILVIRTADGKYAKVEILNYYKNAPTTPDTTSIPRHYKFKYFYQADGSKKLQ